MAKIREIAKFNLAKINPIKVFYNLEKYVNIDTQVCHKTRVQYKKYFTSSGIFSHNIFPAFSTVNYEIYSNYVLFFDIVFV